MAKRDIVVIGASNGGIEALSDLVGQLPEDLAATIFIVQHLSAHSISYLPKMLDARTKLPVQEATDGKHFSHGEIYIAPPDRHLLIDKEQMYLSHGPHENRMRPAIDPLFRSAVLSFGPQVIGIILSGSLDDGTSGLISVKKNGGLTIVQDPEHAITTEMPQSAMNYVEPDYVLPATAIGRLLAEVTQEAVDPSHFDPQTCPTLKQEVEIIKQASGDIRTADQLGKMTPASCPECGGPLWEIQDDVPRYRCHTGHAFTAQTLACGLQDAEEQSLWVALRVMEERVRMLYRMAEKDEQRGYRFTANSYRDKAEEAEQHVQRIRDLLRR